MGIKVDHSKCAYAMNICDCGDDSKSGCCDCGCGDTSTESQCDCSGSGCKEVCPVDAITRKDMVIIDDNKCIECKACIEACPYNALYVS